MGADRGSKSCLHRGGPQSDRVTPNRVAPMGGSWRDEQMARLPVQEAGHRGNVEY